MEQKLAFVKDQTHICLVPSPKNLTLPPARDLGMVHGVTVPYSMRPNLWMILMIIRRKKIATLEQSIFELDDYRFSTRRWACALSPASVLWVACERNFSFISKSLF